MANNGVNIGLKSYDDLFKTDVGRKTEEIIPMQLSELKPFSEQPFKVLDNEDMEELVDSIKVNGVLSPIVVRPHPEGGYEILSGHRRARACEKAGINEVPVVVKNLDDDTAIILLVDSNLQRENILPSEKAFAYKLKLEAMKRKAGRPSKENSRQIVGNYETADIVGKENGESGRQVQRFIRLTELIPELLEYVDQKRLQFTVAVEISYIDKEVQKWLYEYIKDNGMVRLNQVVLLRAQMKTGAITQAKMISMLNNSQPGKGPATKLTFSEKKLREFFPAHYTSTQMRDVIEDLLSDWKHKQDFEGLNGE